MLELHHTSGLQTTTGIQPAYDKLPRPTQEFVDLNTKVLEDASALRALSRLQIRSSLLFRDDDAVMLYSSRSKINTFSTDRAGLDQPSASTVLTLGVSDRDGEMAISIEHDELARVDLTNDSFANLILGYFRKQYADSPK